MQSTERVFIESDQKYIQNQHILINSIPTACLSVAKKEEKLHSQLHTITLPEALIQHEKQIIIFVLGNLYNGSEKFIWCWTARAARYILLLAQWFFHFGWSGLKNAWYFFPTRHQRVFSVFHQTSLRHTFNGKWKGTEAAKAKIARDSRAWAKCHRLDFLLKSSFRWQFDLIPSFNLQWNKPFLVNFFYPWIIRHKLIRK